MVSVSCILNILLLKVSIRVLCCFSCVSFLFDLISGFCRLAVYSPLGIRFEKWQDQHGFCWRQHLQPNGCQRKHLQRNEDVSSRVQRKKMLIQRKTSGKTTNKNSTWKLHLTWETQMTDARAAQLFRWLYYAHTFYITPVDQYPSLAKSA